MTYELSRREFLRTAPAGVAVANDIGAKIGAAAATGLGALLTSFGYASGEQSAADGFAEAVAKALSTDKVKTLADGTYVVETPWTGNQKVKIEYNPERKNDNIKFNVHTYAKGHDQPRTFESDDGWEPRRVIEYDAAGNKVTRTLGETTNRSIKEGYWNNFISAVLMTKKYLEQPVEK